MRDHFPRTLFVSMSLLAAPGFAGPEHKNLRVLPKTITSAELKKTMDGFTEQLGVKCTFCHVLEQYEKDDRPHKETARRMLRLVLDLKAKKATYFAPRVKAAAINCALCHQGKAEPEPFGASLLPTFGFLPPPGGAPTRPKNLQVLPKTTSASGVQKVMDGFTRELGVKCDSCHSSESDKDDRPAKAHARRMMRMVGDLKAKKGEYFGPRVREAALNCGMCHRGKAVPAPFKP